MRNAIFTWAKKLGWKISNTLKGRKTNTNKTFTWSDWSSWQTVTKQPNQNTQIQAEKFLREQGINTKKWVSDYVLKNYWWNADAFMNSFNKWGNNNVTKTHSDTQLQNSWNSLETAQRNTIQRQKDAQVENDNFKVDLTDKYKENLTAEKNYSENALSNANEYFDKNEELIREEDKRISKIENDQKELYQNRIDRDTELLKNKKDKEIDLLNAQAELQRQRNEQDLRQARIDTRLSQRQSAWAFNKHWLWFSSWIINQAQQIATDWITKIAEIEANMNYQEASIKTDIARLDFDYDTLVNKTIDDYTDKMASLEKDAISRITQVNQDIRKNTYDKNKTIEEIEKELRENTKKLQREYIDDMYKVRDKGIEYSKEIQTSISEYQNWQLDKLDNMMKNGSIANMTPWNIAQMEQKLDLPAWTISRQVSNSISSAVRLVFDKTLWEWYSINNMSSIIEQVKEEMSQWRGIEEAISNVTNRELAENEDFIAKQKAQEDLAFMEQQEKRYMSIWNWELFDKLNQKVVNKAEYDKNRYLSLWDWQFYDMKDNVIINESEYDNDRYLKIWNWKVLDKKTNEIIDSEWIWGVSWEWIWAWKWSWLLWLWNNIWDDSKIWDVWTPPSYVWIKVWDNYRWYKISQVYWTKTSPNQNDKWASNWWTPWIDIAMPKWVGIQSFTPWKVIDVYSNAKEGNKNANAWYWNQVVVEDNNWIKHYYSHLSNVWVSIWDEVWLWEVLWESWNTGFSTGSHLDYRALSTDWDWENPDKYLNSLELAEFEKVNSLKNTATELWITIKDDDTIRDIKAKINKERDNIKNNSVYKDFKEARDDFQKPSFMNRIKGIADEWVWTNYFNKAKVAEMSVSDVIEDLWAIEVDTKKDISKHHFDHWGTLDTDTNIYYIKDKNQFFTKDPLWMANKYYWKSN